MPASELVVAGQICLDFIPEFNKEHSFEQVFCPGHLNVVGAAALSTGGAVANTGLAAHKLGLNTVLIGKIGMDSFGSVIQERLDASGARLALNISPDVSSSYTVVLNLAGIERFFLYHPGANDDFSESDIDYELVKRTKIFHFGYPPLLKQFYSNNGLELLRMMTTVKQYGVTTSLDMAMPDPSTDSGRADWEEILKKVAPLTDIFLPSYEELFLMLAREECLKWRSSNRGQDLSGQADFKRVRDFARRLQDSGMGIIVIKAGKNGIYLRTPSLNRLKKFGSITPAPGWADQELWAESLQTESIVSTTGAGDCAIAGFLAALLRGCKPEEAIRLGAVAGYQNLRAVDAVSGLGGWEDLNNDLHNNKIAFNELDLSGVGFRKIQRGLWKI